MALGYWLIAEQFCGGLEVNRRYQVCPSLQEVLRRQWLRLPEQAWVGQSRRGSFKLRNKLPQA